MLDSTIKQIWSNNLTVQSYLQMFFKTIETGTNIAFFPEGGTGNGKQIKFFHSSIFELAISIGYNVQPLLIRMLSINGEKISDENIDNVVFHSHKVSIIAHILHLLSNHSIVVEVDVLLKIPYKTIKKNNITRKEVCLMTENQVKNSFESYLEGHK